MLIELVNKHSTLKNILSDLDLLPIESNYKTLKNIYNYMILIILN